MGSTCLGMRFDWPTDRLRVRWAVLTITRTATSVAVALIVLGHTAAGAAIRGNRETGSSSPAEERSNTRQPEREQPRLWSVVAEDTLSAPDPNRHIESGNYRTLRLNREILTALLARVPLEGMTNDVVLELPWPDGTFL